MAPFVEMEWGKDAYDLMKQIKGIFDPLNILNPGVIMNPDINVHLKNLKPIPVASEIIDKCTECGFCEPSCVSAGLTLTPRQRIVIHREIISLSRSGREPHIAAALSGTFNYSGDETCATDGLCATACPVKIDTGKLIKNLRFEKIGTRQHTALWLASNMSFVTAFMRGSLSLVSLFHSLLGSSVMNAISGGLRKVSGNRIPMWNPYMPKGSSAINTLKEAGNAGIRKVVYFPSCINRSMGVSKDHREEQQLSSKMASVVA